MRLERGAKTVLLVAAFVGVCAGIKLADTLLAPFFLAAFIATVTAPLVLWLVSKRVPRGIAVLLAVLVDLAALAGIAALVGGSINAFYSNLPRYQQMFAILVDDTTMWLSSKGLDVKPESFSSIAGPADLMNVVAAMLRGVAEVLSNIVLVLVIVVFMLFEATGLKDKLIRALSDEEAGERYASTVREVNKYLLVKTGTSAATGLFVGVWVWLWGLDLPLLWGLIAFLLNYIPTIGSIVAAIPAVLLALLQLGLGGAIAVASGYVAVNFAIGNFLEPRLLGRALGMSPLVVFLSVVVWGWLLGPIGALLSVPLTMMVKIFLASTDDLHWAAVLLEPAHRVRSDTIPPTPPDVAAGRKPKTPKDGVGPERTDPAPGE